MYPESTPQIIEDILDLAQGLQELRLALAPPETMLVTNLDQKSKRMTKGHESPQAAIRTGRQERDTRDA